jgi:hypothetical protein
MGYKAVTRIKVGTWKENEEGEPRTDSYIEVGEEVSEGDFDEDQWDELVAAKAVVDEEEYDRIRPELVEGFNQPFGTPSNLFEIEGTELQANMPDPEEAEEAPAPPPPMNPADPPYVEKAEAEAPEPQAKKTAAKSAEDK